MLMEISQTIMKSFQVRKSRGQKAAFRAWMMEELQRLGYTAKEEKSRMACNLVVGNPEQAKLICTAHYDTCAVLPVPNFITPRNLLWYLLYQLLIVIPVLVLAVLAEVLVIVAFDPPMQVAIGVVYVILIAFFWWLIDGPANRHNANDNTSGVMVLAELAAALPQELRDSVCFVFFDNEEKGLLGSSAFAKWHKKVKQETLLLNFDCVGDGDFIQFFPSKTVKKDVTVLKQMEDAFPSEAEKTVEVVREGGFYPSDQYQFVRGIGVCALKKNRLFGYYMDRIHTGRDTVLEEENIRLLCEGTLRLAETLTR